MQLVLTGVTRMVFLTRRYAIKVPRIDYGWFMFLTGLLSNIAEVSFSVLAEEFHLCPCVWHIPGGWLNVQPRCRPLSDQEWAELNDPPEHEYSDKKWYGMSCDFQRANFGVLNNEIVLLDYGNVT